MVTLAGAIRHLRNGTLLSRFQQAIAEQRRKANCRDWFLASREGERLIAEIAPSVSMNLYMGDELSRLIYCRGFEHAERQFVVNFLRTEDIFVDVGANIGLYTILASAVLGTSGKVIAIEPSLVAFERLRENVSEHGNENVEVLQCALSSECSQLRLMQSDRGKDAWNSVSSGNGESVGERGVTVEAITLDRVVEERGIAGRLSLVKVDVEGWETHVLRGASRILSRDDAPVLMVEFSDEAARDAASSCQELYRLIESFGYRIYEYSNVDNCLVHSPMQQSYPYQNLFAVKDLEAVTDLLTRAGQY